MEVNSTSSAFPLPRQRPAANKRVEPVSPFDTSWWLPPIINNGIRPKKLVLLPKPIPDDKSTDESDKQREIERLKEESERERMEAEEAISRGHLFLMLRKRAMKKNRGKVCYDSS